MNKFMDIRLEELSEKVRKGIPVDFWEALEVIEYQTRLQKEREAKRKTWVYRFFRLIRNK